MQKALQVLLTDLAKELSSFLEEFFSEVGDNSWWESCVLAKLTFKQLELVEQYGLTSLSSLDLAALLRVFDQNWYEISKKKSYPVEIRNYLKEMQTIRNRWAHVSADGYDREDIYRDLDTLERFATAIDVRSEMLEEIRELKKKVIGSFHTKEESKANSFEKSPNEEAVNSEKVSLEFDVGTVVLLRADLTKRGVVVKVIPGVSENRFEVFIDNEAQSFYASQLIKEQVDERGDEYSFQKAEKFHAYLSALQIKHPASSKLYSLHAARVDFIPYQFRPVLKFIRADRPRILIADGVGVGKTIEAGLILRELQARREIQSVLIVCPRPLVTEKKWYREMKRFDEKFVHLDGKLLRDCMEEADLEGEWPREYSKAILPFSLLDEALLFGTGERKKRGRKKMGLLELDPPPRFDLVIVDEAHHVRNPETFRHKAVKYFCDNAEAVVFLSATPVQLGSNDLFVLLNLLRPDLVIDRESFDHMAAPNPYINRAVGLARGGKDVWQKEALEALDEAAQTEWGSKLLINSPLFRDVKEKLSSEFMTQEERVEMIGALESLHTFDSIINRTRRRDIGEFTVRKSVTVSVEFTEDQKNLYDSLMRIQTEIFSNMHGNRNIAFMMTTIRRQAASSLHGLKPFLRDILYRHFDFSSIEDAEEMDLFEVDDDSLSGDIRQKIDSLLNDAELLDDEDPKLEKLKHIVRSKRNLPNNRVMVFSSFRHTLRYIYDKLKVEGFRVALVDGSVPDEERAELRRRFEKDRNETDAIDIMLFSEVGSEGLDYQFCDCLINYDLPWNPMRIEQRIGRIDRWGQQSESVMIYNMITPGTIDADIYHRCLMRIGIFEASLGASEEILGEITESLHDIANDFTLTEEERQEKLQQLADNQVRLVQEQEKLEKEQAAFFGLRLPEKQWNKELNDASSFWIEPPGIENLVREYFKSLFGSEQEYILGEKALKTLRISQEGREQLLKDYKKLSVKNRDWERWLKGGSQHLAVTFDAVCASEHPQAVFLTPVHPLVRQAAHSIREDGRLVAAMEAEDGQMDKGRYLFAVYRWHYLGIREEVKLRVVCKEMALASQIERVLGKAKSRSVPDEEKPPLDAWEKLDSQHYEIWNRERERHRRKVAELVAYRRESLVRSHQARMAVLEEQMSKVADEKIRRMRKAQMESAETDYQRHIKELKEAEERNDILTQDVAYGVLYIV